MVASTSAITAPTVASASQISGTLITERPTTVPENSAAHRYMSSTVCRCEWPMFCSRWCRCWRSAANGDCPASIRRTTASSRSVYGMIKIAIGSSSGRMVANRSTGLLDWRS